MDDYKELIAEARAESVKALVAQGYPDDSDYVLFVGQMNHVGRVLSSLADALESASVERAVVEAQALEQAADDMERSWRYGLVDSSFAWLRARAVEIREGRQ